MKKVAATYNSRDVVGLVLQQTRVLKAAFEAARTRIPGLSKCRLGSAAGAV